MDDERIESLVRVAELRSQQIAQLHNFIRTVADKMSEEYKGTQEQSNRRMDNGRKS